MTRVGEVIVNCASLRELLVSRCGLSPAAIEDRCNITHSVLHRLLGGSKNKRTATTTAKRPNVLALMELARGVLNLTQEELPMSCVLARSHTEVGSEPAATTFSTLLSRHLRSGTRPDGQKRPWTSEEFARTVGWSVHAVDHWCAGGQPPGDIEVILGALFGPNREAEPERLELTEAWASGRPPELRKSPLFPKSIKSLGQQNAVDQIVSGILGDEPQRAVLVQGGPGIGKTTLTLEAADRDRTRTRFGSRRWVVFLDAASSVSAFDAALCRALGFDPAITRFDAALALLQAAPGLLVLDNLETPWEADRLGLEDRLAQLQGVRTLVILASVRGMEVVGGLSWSLNLEILPLPPPVACTLFLSLTPRIAGDDPYLQNLLAELGGVPLAITLVALRASPFSNLEDVWEQWREFGVEFAKRVGVEPSARTSLAQSIAFSVASKRVSAIGHKMFRVLGFLPGGLRPADRAAICGPLAFDGAFELLAVGLAQERSDRLVLLPPVRDYAHRFLPPDDMLRETCVDYFLDLTHMIGSRIWGDGGGDAVRRLWPEWENIEAALADCSTTGEITKAKGVMKAVSRLLSTTGGGTIRVLAALESACVSSETEDEPATQAVFALTQGEVAFYRSDGSAEAHFTRALQYLQRAGNAPGAAICSVRANRGLADMAMRRGEFGTAETLLNEVYAAAKSLGDHFGEGYALEGLGECASRRGDRAEAKRLFDAALAPYKLGGQVLGVANATKCLADLSLQEEDIEQASKLLQAASSLYIEAEIALGDANCRSLLADIEVFSADRASTSERDVRLQAAFATYEAIAPIYVRVGDALGEGNCYYNMAEVERRRGRLDYARPLYAKALARYEQISEPTSIGHARKGLAQISEGSERAAWIASAREAWGVLPHLLPSLDAL